MADEADSRVLAKLILLEQLCCDTRTEASHMRTFAVILDACYDKPRCFIGPTAIGKIAGIDEKTVRTAIKGLTEFGYLDVERRNERSNWLMPNFGYAQRSGCLVSRKDGQLKINKPFRVPKYTDGIAGAHTRYGPQKEARLAGVQAQASGSAGPGQRVSTPAEAVKETIQEAVDPSRLSDEQRQQQKQERQQAEQERSKAAFQVEYKQALVTHPKHAQMMERTPWIRKHIEDLIQERAA